MSAHALQERGMPDGQLVAATLAGDFRSAMRRLASTVTIITASSDGLRHGMTATAVTSLTASPPSLLICVNQSASIHDPIVGSRRFCVNLLARDHGHLVPVFSGKLTGEERFATGEWLTDESGLPCLADAQASIFCNVVGTLPHGSHTIFVGEVGRVALSGEPAPLLYQEGALFRSVALNA